MGYFVQMAKKISRSLISKTVRVEQSRDTGQSRANLPSLDDARDERGSDVTPTPAAIADTKLPPELEFTPVPRQRQTGRNTITPHRQRAFIRALAETGSVALASKVIGNAAASLYTLKLRPDATSFAAAWDAAVQLGARQILDILVDHAINGTPEFIYKDGEIVAERRVFNYRMMMWIVTHAMPEYFGVVGGLQSHGATSSGLKKLKAKWEAEFKERYDADLSAVALAKAETDDRKREEQRKEILPAALVKIYQTKVRQERGYRLRGQTTHADMTLRQLTHIELYMEFGGLVEPEITRFFDDAADDPHPWETEAGRAITAHREAAWAMDEKNSGILRPPLVRHSLGDGGSPMHSAMRGGEHMSKRTRAREQAERQMAEAQALWEACATEESWAAHEK